MHPIGAYATIVFDCDGVIFDSNHIKTQAFRDAALPYGLSAADALARYHIENGGVSRYEKFRYFLDQIASDAEKGPDLGELLNRYAATVREGLMRCRLASGLERFRARTQRARWLVVSGGDQQELRDVFALRQIAEFFDGGIYGSPDTKNVILRREIASCNIRFPGLFVGDSRYDHEAAAEAGLDFAFVQDWSEFDSLRSYAALHSIPYFANLAAVSEAA